jgi:hypothetical protein
MRWYEIITENDGSSSASGGGSGKKKPFIKQQRDVIPGADSYPDTPAHYYNMYRFGVHMAGSPDEQSFNPNGPSANEMVTLAYSQSDLDIIKKTAKAMGYKSASMTSQGSHEPTDTYTTSPVAKWS